MSNDAGLISTGQAAAILGSSRQHVVDLCKRGVLTSASTGAHRRLVRRDVEHFARSRSSGSPSPQTRAQRRSRWLHTAVAGRLVRDPEAVLKQAQVNLEHMADVHADGMSARWLNEWRSTLEAGPDAVVQMLTSGSPLADELRQNSPFAGVLSDRERQATLAAFRRSERSR